MAIRPKSALLVVDVQNDFLPGGALAVSKGDRIVPVINRYIGLFQDAGRPILASRDWHPPETTHFKPQGGPWPPHCIAETEGAAFHPDLRLPQGTLIVSKGMGAREDAYSAFQARDPQGRLLVEVLRDLGIERIYICGLTLDYCVRYSALDAAAEGFGFTVLLDATRAVNVNVHDAELALIELVRAGAELAIYETL
jgi:nicotinamidase/pyrazinamidase